MNTGTSKIYNEFISSIKEQLLNDFPLICFVKHKKSSGYWTAEDTNLMGIKIDDEQYKLRSSIYLLLILESEEIGGL